MCDSGKFHYSNNCQECNSCSSNCTSCPKGACQSRSMYLNNMNRINKQVRMASSLGILKLKAMNVSRQVGQSANPFALIQAGGPGDLISSIQKTNNCGNLTSCKTTTYRLPIAQRRTANKNKSGVDKKHGSYTRYLARRTGGVLRKEMTPLVRNNTAFIHQPRNRTGTAAGCTNYAGCNKNSAFKGPTKFLGRTRTAFKCNNIASQNEYKNKIANTAIYPRYATQYDGINPLFGPSAHIGLSNGDCCNLNCCNNRIPGGKDMGKFQFKCNINNNCSRNNNSKNVSGLLGNNTQGVPSKCGCCKDN